MPDPNDNALNQRDRLAAIAASDLLDGGAIPALDRVARLTADLLRVPVVQLNVITADRQVPVSHVGGDTWSRSVDLSRSYCQAAIQTGEPLVVEDARKDPRFAASTVDSEDAIVAYLSIPLLSPRSSAPLATLCVVDFEPRHWTEREIAQLTDMGAWALGEIELRAGLRRELAEKNVALRESDARYQALFDSIDEGFCVIEVIFDDVGRAVDYVFVETNAAFVEQTGLVDAVGKRMRYLAPDHEEHWFERYGRVARTGEPIRFEEGARALGRWYDVYAFRTGRPEERRVAVLFRDVAEKHSASEERERLLEALRLERERLAEVIRRAPAFMVVLRGENHVLEIVNDAYMELIGGRDVVGKPLFDAIPEARGQGYEEVMNRVLETGESFVGRALPISLKRDADGGMEERIVDVAYVPLTEVDGTRTDIVVMGTDVTDQARAWQEVERARDRAERLQALTAALAGASTVDDIATVVVSDMVGALGARTGALAARDPDGSDHMLLLRTVGFPDSVVPGVRRQPFDLQSPLTECFLERAPIWIETRDGPDGLDARYPPIAPVWDALGVESAAFVPLVAAGEAVGVISFAFDGQRVFTEEDRGFLLALGSQAALAMERARLFEAEHAARAEAERANRAKSEFLAVMSHELRTPLNAIAGYIELIDMGIRGPVTAQQHEDLGRVQASQRHLLGLINEVLNYARLETGTVHYEVGDMRVRDVISAAEALVAPQAQARDLDLVVTPCPPEIIARADIEKVRQILVNLLSNAVKFTDRGGRIELSCSASDDAVNIVVADNGVGIPPDQLNRIFDPFVQVRSDLTRTAEGTGLGLAISRDLARAMGGDLSAQSTAGEGSVFTVTLPVPAVET
ncbi:MAG TPA: ATP-binding protein [Longimicrobiales bacterium]|nr:ATP-binding protein [Longimicrobiales bacterium]